jgi:hypothetical protein
MTRDQILNSVDKLKRGKTFIIGSYDKRDRRIERRISWWLERLEKL